MSSGHFIR
jgi:hypothetical protein